MNCGLPNPVIAIRYTKLLRHNSPDDLRKIAGTLYVLADAIDAGTARYLHGAIVIDTNATTFEAPTNDGRMRISTGQGRHGFPQGTMTIRADVEFLTGQPARA